MAKAAPFSFRPSQGLDARLAALARQTGFTKTAILESLADEAERCRRYPGIAFRGTEGRRRSWLLGCGLDIWELIWMLEDYSSREALMEAHPAVEKHHIRIAEAYHREFPREIDDKISDNHRPLEEWKREFPFVEIRQVDPSE